MAFSEVSTNRNPDLLSRRVTVGLPVRNGEQTLRLALDKLINQTHRDIEIVISDNASSDATPNICREYLEADGRVRYIRHSEPLTFIQNWAAVYQEARTPYFMWASHDDERNDRYIEVLLSALERHPEAGLAFGQVVKFRGFESYDHLAPFPYRFNTRGRSIAHRLLMDKQGGFALYGLFRTEILSPYEWWDHTVSPDWPLLIHLLVRSEIVQVDEAVLYYRYFEVKSGQERAMRQSYRPIERYPTLKLSWTCGLASKAAARSIGRRRSATLDAALVFAGILWMNRRSLLRYAKDK